MTRPALQTDPPLGPGATPTGAGPERRLERAYDGSSAALKALRAWGWGPLLNLGYFEWRELWCLLFGMRHFQRRLAREAIELLDPRPGELVLDVGCGRGWTTARIAASGARAIGIDLLASHIELARTEFGTRSQASAQPRVEFAQGDATRLSEVAGAIGVERGTVDAILCLEAGFHFGAEGRRDFLAGAHEMLRPGGRLVLVDLTWRDERPSEIALLDRAGLVRQTWQFDEFEPLARYRACAAALGFREQRMLDWSAPVIDSFQRLLDALNALAQPKALRRLWCLLRPGLSRLSPAEWDELTELLLAHDQVRRRTRYMAMVYAKPLEKTPRGG